MSARLGILLYYWCGPTERLTRYLKVADLVFYEGSRILLCATASDCSHPWVSLRRRDIDGGGKDTMRSL
jgi:hypothetical protein